MKKQLRHIIFYPFSLLYGIATGIRNWLFDKEILKSESFDISTISVGNLSVGGTGKTPHTELILSALKAEWKTAMLSRGYKRKTKGFVLADENANSRTLGDEPFQIYRKYPDVTVAVDEKRVNGVRMLLKKISGLELVVLDDAFQHRHIQPGLSVLLTEYNNLYTHDLPMPAGRLREWKRGSKRADVIVVTKCPNNLKPIDMRIVESDLKVETNQSLFFSCYEYSEPIAVFPESGAENWTYERLQKTQTKALLVAGIVSPEAITEHLEKLHIEAEKMFFPDHYDFQQKDISMINERFEKLNSPEKLILVTEKDAARLISNPNYPDTLKPRTFALPIRVKILQNQEMLFIQKLKNYVVENSRNS